MRRLIILPLAVIALAALPPQTDAFTVGVQDQGADPTALAQVASDLGARTVRVIASPAKPETALIKHYRDEGLKVQAAITVKRQTTSQDILSLVRSWHGAVRTVSVGNEPELNGVPPCVYARLFARVQGRLRVMGIVLGFGEFSPIGAFEYIKQIARCHVRIRGDFTAVHPYQFFSDPLGAPTERSGVGSWLGLGNLHSFQRRLRGLHLPSRLRATEFSYLVDGRYKISMARCTTLWPRAIQAARKYLEQLIIYGIGHVPKGTWGSACLLDEDGHRTSAFLAIAKELGRTLTAEHVLPPTGVLPDGAEPDSAPVLPVVVEPVAKIDPPVEPPKVDPPVGETTTTVPAPPPTETVPATQPEGGP